MKKNKLGIMSIFTFLFFLLACTMPSERVDNLKYGIRFNGARAYLGIPLIEPDWINHESNSDSSFFWMNKSRKLLNSQPHHYYKTSELKKGLIALEEDGFHYTFNEQKSYMFVVKNTFASDSVLSSWEYELVTYHKGKYPPTTSIIMGSNQADSLLEAWKLDYRLPKR